MTILFPRPLARGSKIAIVAPSSPVPPELEPRLDLVLANLKRLGFDPNESSCLRSRDIPPRSVRLAAWMEALLDDENDAVMPPWGGDLAIELLSREGNQQVLSREGNQQVLSREGNQQVLSREGNQRVLSREGNQQVLSREGNQQVLSREGNQQVPQGMDFERLRRARPKWVLGYSDISTLLLPLLLELGWASAHGPNLMDLVPAQTDPLTTGALGILASSVPFTQRSSTHYQTAFVDWKRTPGVPFQLDQPTRIHSLDGLPVRVSGRLIGGCIDTCMHLIGTAFGDVPGFLRRHRDEGVIVFLENCDLTPAQLTRALTQMRLAGWFADVRAVIVGRSSSQTAQGEVQAAVLRSVFDGLATPVVHGADIGHQPPQWTLIEGALATLHVEDGVAEIRQERPGA